MDCRQFLESAALTFAAAATPALQPAVVRTTVGMVSGYGSGKTQAFQGIPDGADTRATRFQAPRPVAPWSDIRACTDWPTRAPQDSPERGAAGPNVRAAGINALEDATTHYHLPPDEVAQSEDCLHLNLWTPAVSKTAHKRPVLFYIHGGAYNNGTANADLYDGTRLAERDAVVVTVNHRFNAFGFMYLAQLNDLYKDAGNVGMLDLVLALEWVRDNIAGFGGDPGNVTLFGQSGGGAKCATLMAMLAAKGLFHKVLTMSGWVYQMNFGTSTADGRASHTEDLTFIFDNLKLSPGMVGSSLEELAAAQPLATQISSILLADARTGNPDYAGLPRWPVYALKQRQTMLFDRASLVALDPRGREREMMVGAHYRQPGT